MSLIYQELIPVSMRQEFCNKVVDIARTLGTNPNYLMQVMKSESGLNPAAYNPSGGASGLIQFMPDTAKGLGTTTTLLRQMNHVKQLDYVLKYFLPFRKKLKSYFDVYLVTFFPIAVGKPDSYVFETKKLSAALIAQQNPAINKWPKDSKITMGEFKEYLRSTVPQQYKAVVFNESANPFDAPTLFPVLAIAAGVGLILLYS